MIEDNHMLEAWYRYAASLPGFIGAALQVQRGKMSITQEQQRAFLGIQGDKYDSLWLHLQGMLLPRPDHFLADLERIVQKVERDGGIAPTIRVASLAELLRTGLV